jgi:hypothetical protein
VDAHLTAQKSYIVARPIGHRKIRVGLSALFVGVLKAVHTGGSFIHSLVGLRMTLVDDELCKPPLPTRIVMWCFFSNAINGV